MREMPDFSARANGTIRVDDSRFVDEVVGHYMHKGVRLFSDRGTERLGDWGTASIKISG
jgi:hypothetical protein